MRAIGVEAISYAGTTLLSMILGSHPNCKSVGHVYVYFPPFVKKKEKFQRGCDICELLEKECPLEKLIGINPDPLDIYDVIKMLVLDKKEIIIDSSSTTPWFNMSQPDEIVWMFRDPVSLASSYKKKGFKLDYMINAYLKKYSKASGLAIDYKHIIMESVELKGLFRKLGLEFSPEYMEYWNFDNHAISGNKGVLLNYAKKYRPDKVEHVIEEISAGNKAYMKYYQDAQGNFDGSVDILTTEEKIIVQRACNRVYKSLQELEACLT